MVYNIWRVRNDLIWQEKLWSIQNTVQRIIREVQLRVKYVVPKKVNREERQWIEFICTK